MLPILWPPNDKYMCNGWRIWVLFEYCGMSVNNIWYFRRHPSSFQNTVSGFSCRERFRRALNWRSPNKPPIYSRDDFRAFHDFNYMAGSKQGPRASEEVHRLCHSPYKVIKIVENTFLGCTKHKKYEQNRKKRVINWVEATAKNPPSSVQSSG